MNGKTYLLGALAGVVALFGLGYCGVAKADPLVDQVFGPSVQLGDFCSGEIIHSKRDEKTDKVSTIVLSAKHCVMDDTKKLVTINKAVYDTHNRKTGVKTYIAEVLGTSFKSDLAVLKLRDQSYLFTDVAKVAKSDTPLRFGQDVVVVGYPLGRSMTYTEGNLGFVEDNVFSDISESKQFYRATPDIAPGSSGSSMFTLVDGEYQIIGVVTGGASQFSWFNFFTPIEEINEYLDVVSKTFDKDE
jgi:Trypsin-like serine proteases, typically periplasmic, contain C-terminal PDZ domain